MAINFPDSPSVGDEFTGGGFTWTWNGSSWEKVVALSENIEFAVPLGSLGITNFALTTPIGPTAFSISSANLDPTFDIYLIAEDDTLAGYSNSNSIEASKAFDRVIIYGGQSGDIFTFSSNPTATGEAPTDLAIGVPPAIASISTTQIQNIDDTITVTGHNFASDISASFVGTDNVSVLAKNVTRNSFTEIVVTRPDSLLLANEPYSLVLSNPGISDPTTNVHILNNSLFLGTPPTWNTAATLSDAQSGVFYSTTISASDADGQAVSYSKVSGDSGITVSLAGTVTATFVESGAKTFTARATDTSGQSIDREFTINVYAPSAAGGEITLSNGYFYHTFTESDDFILSATKDVDYLIVGGGGGAGAAGPGGGGGYRQSVAGYASGGGASAESSVTVAAGTYPVVVGAGGAHSDSSGFGGAFGQNGGASSWNGISSLGGGGGAYSNFGGWTGRSGGCGGGAASAYDASGSGGAGTAGQGYRGGNATERWGYSRVGGGGGAGGAGTDAPNGHSSETGIAPGAPLQWIDGVYRSEGGAGFANDYTPSSGVLSHHGANRGGGGSRHDGGSGILISSDDGVVILRYAG